MGNIIFGFIVISIYGMIIVYLSKPLKTKGTVCTSCKKCPFGQMRETGGKINLLALVEQMEKEGFYEHSNNHPKT